LQGDAYVDLYSFLAPDEDRVEASRFFIEETEPTGDEDRDFAELLSQFRKKLADHVPEDDAGSHYDLGLAFKEMGLLEDAINQFQVALRAGQDRLKVFEELGQCFLMKKQYNIAVKVLTRALTLGHGDEWELIGVYYHLGRAYEELGEFDSARDAYERVMGLDIRFRDVESRMARL
jgi:tetratricopeptide (TPR) repeat protein